MTAIKCTHTLIQQLLPRIRYIATVVHRAALCVSTAHWNSTVGCGAWKV